VILPPGRARLAMNPERTGSPTPTMTMGMADVARRAAIVAGVVHATMTSTLLLTSSVTTLGSWSNIPCGQRTSMDRFCFSTQPRPRIPSRNALNMAGVGGTGARTPMRQTFGCCATASQLSPAADIAPRAPSLRCASHAAATLVPSKGRPASSNHITCTADHLPPRAAGNTALLEARCNGPQ
jgi:hypothetical protein